MNLTKTLESARNVIRFQHKSHKTEKAYLHWIARYAHHCRNHPEGDHADKVRSFLTALARDRAVSISTQKQALNAIVFLYRHVLRIDVGDFSGTRPQELQRVLGRTLTLGVGDGGQPAAH